MPQILTLNFASNSDLQRQMKIWLEIRPSIFSKSCHFMQDSSTSSCSLSFRGEDFDDFKGLNLHSAVRHSISTTDTPLLTKTSLWTLLPWYEYVEKQENYYCLISGGQLQACIGEAFRLGVFNIQYQWFENNRMLIKMMFPPYYFLLWLQEQLNAPIFWLDSHMTFLPLAKKHPLQEYWARDDQVRLVQADEILNLGSFDLKFKNIVDQVSWQYDLNEQTITPAEESLNLVIRLGLKQDLSLKESPACFWFYGIDERQRLEDWIVNLTREQREEFLILGAEEPFKGYFLVLKNEVRPELVSPPASQQRFYRIFSGEPFFAPVGLRLQPNLPLNEFRKIFPLDLGKSLLLWSQIDALHLLYLDDHRFDDLQSLIHYVVSDYQSDIQKMRSHMVFQDPRLVLFDWAVPESFAGQQTDDLSKDDLVTEESFDEVFEEEYVSDHFDAELVPTKPQLERVDQTQVLEQIRILQQELIAEPFEGQSPKWLQLGLLENRLGNYSGALACLKLGMFLNPTDGTVAQIYRSTLLECYINSTDSATQNAASELIQSDGDLDYSSSELTLLGFYLVAKRAQLTVEEHDFFSRRYLVALESGLQKLFLSNLCVIAFQGLLESESNQYLIMKIKDHVLFTLFEFGLYESSDLPHFLVESRSEVQTLEMIESLHGRLEQVFRKSNDSQRNRNEAMFHMVFAVGYAINKNSAQMSNQLDLSKNILNRLNDAVLKALYDCYEEIANRTLNQNSVGLNSLESKLDHLTQAQRYKANRLIDKSVILRSDQSEELTDLINHDIVGFRDRTDAELLQLIPDKLKSLQMDSNMPQERLSYKRKQHFCAILDNLPRLGESFTFQIVEEIYNQFGLLAGVEHRGSVLGKMLALAYLFEHQNWIGVLYQNFIDLVDEIESYRLKAMIELLQPIVEYFPKMVSERECLELIQKVLARLQDNIASHKIRILLVRVLDSKDQQEFAREQLKVVLNAYFNKQIEDQQERLELYQFLLWNARQYTLELKKWLCERLIDSFERIDDHLSVNEHFSLSKVQAMEFMIYTNPQENSVSPELNKFLIEFEYLWKKQFFNWLRTSDKEKKTV